MVGAVIFCVAGAIFVCTGFLIWKKEMISLLHGYHYDKVYVEDKHAFCRLSGIGVIVIGAGICISGVIVAVCESEYCFIPMAIGFLAGLATLVVAGFKYNQDY